MSPCDTETSLVPLRPLQCQQCYNPRMTDKPAPTPPRQPLRLPANFIDKTAERGWDGHRDQWSDGCGESSEGSAGVNLYIGCAGSAVVDSSLTVSAFSFLFFFALALRSAKHSS